MADRSSPEKSAAQVSKDEPRERAGHANAVLALLDREPPPGYAGDLGGAFRQAAIAQGPEHQLGPGLSHRRGVVALPIERLEEIAELRTIHSLPHRRNSIVLGLANVRGELVLCVSLARILGLDDAMPRPVPARENGRGRLLVLRHDGGPAAIPVDEVRGAQRYHPQDLRPGPATLHKATASYTSGLLPWGDKMISCLDFERLMRAVKEGAA